MKYRIFAFTCSLFMLPAVMLLAYLRFLPGFACTASHKQRRLQIEKDLPQLGACLGVLFLVAGLNLWPIESAMAAAIEPEIAQEGDEYLPSSTIDLSDLRATILSVSLETIESVGHGVNIYDYLPGAPGNKLVVPDTPPSLSITENYPRLDGAIALLPVYGAAAQALYANLPLYSYEKYVDCNNTPEAWELLIGGYIDIFFGVPPSSEQLQTARAEGFEPEITPIAKDAFVFMVNIHNPVNGLSVEQIRDIYRKKITNWKDVDGENEKIMAFQRPEGSGSQTAMTEQVMGGLELADPLREEYMIGMGDIINAVAEFRNRRESIGYTFRWYSQVQFPSDQIKLLAINGVSPLPENIANDTYPFTVPLVAVTVRPRSPETQALIDWLLGPEGQALIRKTGYVPLHPD